ncbi:hypothetical protein RV06_GL001520 [Enterococcus haemoperoxidus]|nr:hypothetical protein RV06_GL001520 [Enterococcus haemoperoxidus]
MNYLQLIWFLGNKKYTTLRQTIVLSSLLIFHILFIFLFNTPFIGLFLFLFIVFQPIFIVRHLNSWLLMALFLYLQSSLIITSWLFTYDLPVYLSRIGKISPELLQQLVPFLLSTQQLLLFVLILFVRWLDQKLQLFDSIAHVQKNYKMTVLFLTFLLIFLYFLRQFAVYSISYSSFLYLTVILLGLNSVFHFTVYLYSRYYQEQLRKLVLSQQYNNDLDKITLADEFRHDYRSILVSLVGYIEEYRMEEASAFILSVTDYSKNLLDEDSYDQLKRLMIPPIQGLLLQFIESCEKNGIHLRISIPQKIYDADISISLIDSIRSLSTLLDFIIKQQNTESKKQIYLTFEKKPHSIFIELSNLPKQQYSEIKQPDYLITDKKNLKTFGIAAVPMMLKNYRKASFAFYFNHKKCLIILTLPLKYASLVSEP